MKRVLVYLLFAVSVLTILFNCNTEEKNPYLNTQKDQAHYVGMSECKSCHPQIYETFIQTGMGQSWGIANKEKSAADFSPSKAIVYDSIKNFYYKPFWDGDSLCILEFRLNGKDTVHKRLEKVSYIVGSGQHTNSHIININGYLHQAPITFYTQKGTWDLAPGFEKGMNTRFDRKIELECITCHNGYPNFVEGSLNKFTDVKLGIDCERCHGPGSVHVANKKDGILVDTSKGPDFSIVNPRRLSTDQQNSLCQRCHLQGIAVLNNESSFLDFLPSEKLSKTMNVFMPNYGSDDKHMIMASHVERLKMSRCFVNSGKMSCITCHNPHVSVKFTPQEQYVTACNSCHTVNNTCTETKETRALKQNFCPTCHMPKNGSIDIPHVAVTDHLIRKRPMVENKDAILKFLGMKCYNNPDPNARTKARAYLEFFERYEPKQLFLDSAFFYLQQAGLNEAKDADDDLIRAFFLKENYSKIKELSESLQSSKVMNAWTAYRIGESFLKQNNADKAIPYLQRAIAIKPLALDFQDKLANAYLAFDKYREAKSTCEFILRENPKYANAYSNLGYISMQEHNFDQARIYFEKSIQLNPDDVQTLINLAVVYHQLNQTILIKPILLHAQTLDSKNQQIKAMLDDLN